MMAALVGALLDGDHAQAMAECEKLRDAGVAPQQIITEGVEVAMAKLDAKCTVDQFNLLEIMLCGRAVTGVMKDLYPPGTSPLRTKGAVVLGALEGDVHDLGKNILKTVLTAAGYRVVDCGKDCPIEKLIDAAESEGAVAVGVSGLLTMVIAQVFGHAATLAGVPVGDYVRDGELLAQCQIQALDRHDYDAVFALMDVNVETEAAGPVLAYRADAYPVAQSYALAGVVEPDALAIPDPSRDGRMPELLRAARILRREVGDEVLVVGCVLGPMTLAMQLLGPEAALYLAIDEPDRFARVLDFAASVVVRFGLAQIEAGVHLPIVFDPSSSPDVIPSSFYREFVVPQLARVFSAFKQAGSAANWLHTAGPVESILPFYPPICIRSM